MAEEKSSESSNLSREQSAIDTLATTTNQPAVSDESISSELPLLSVDRLGKRSVNNNSVPFVPLLPNLGSTALLATSRDSFVALLDEFSSNGKSYADLSDGDLRSATTMLRQVLQWLNVELEQSSD